MELGSLIPPTLFFLEIALVIWSLFWFQVFLRWLSGKESICNAGVTGDVGSIPGLGRFPEEGHGNPLQYSCLENTMDRGAWHAIVHGVAKMTQLKWLSIQAQK